MEAKKRKLKDKLVDKYRLVILNDDTFEEKLSVNLTRLNVFIIVGFSIITLITLTTLLISLTPLREFIPGYSSTSLKKSADKLSEKTDSLTVVLKQNKKQLNSIRNTILGNHYSSSDKQKASKEIIEEKFLPIPTSKKDSLLREQVAKEDKYNVDLENNLNSNFVLFPPVKGSISESYNIDKKHYGIDIVVAENTPVKAVANGIVIFAEWTAETGNVIIIKHANQLLTIYKHNKSLNKTQGDLVKSGEVIAFSGATGELSTGPHLHFELWSNGYALNPVDFIDF